MNNKNSEINVRKINEDDWRLLKTTRLNALKDSPLSFSVSYLEASHYSELEWRERASGLRNIYFIAFSGKHPIGILGGKPSSTWGYTLIGMWVAPTFRGHGASNMLINHFKKFIFNRGCKEIFLSVSPDNKK
ncbi:GNAT family N-acetyltransferase, partial [Pantoea allii]